jgi:predicted transcriptional regulator
MTDTTIAAHAVASQRFGDRCQRILQLLRQHGPLALFEIAEAMGVADHQLSGRLTTMAKAGVIRRTGAQRTKPSTGCKCELWEIIPEADRPQAEPPRASPERHDQGELFTTRKVWPD